nr:ATP-dependent zinc metalloprotease FtsH [Blautia sp. AF34-10]
MDDRKNQNREPENGSGGGPKNRQTILIILICLLVSLMVMGLLNNALGGITSEDLDYSKFLDMVNNDEVQEVVLKSGTLTVTPKDQKSEGITYQVTMMGDEQELVDLLQEKGITYHKDPPDSTGTIIYTLLTVILPVVMLVAVMVWVMRSMNKGGGVMGVGKSRAKAYVQKETGVTFRDVAGQDEAKESLQEVVDFLHNPGKYTTIGAKLPKGALLVGPPGTGKTLLAKAVAGEAHVPFFSMSASEFVEMFVGVGASRVRDLFEEAKKNAPCIIFIDEIDAIGKSRDNSYNSNDEREQTLNQLLAEMDGFDSSKGILILAATNRPEVLDPALLRPGRFDRRIIVERPDLKGRVEILKVHAKNVSLDETVDLDGIALATSGAVGSDLANMINEAAILAVKNGRKAVSQKDLLEAVEVVLVGKEKKDRILSQEERKIVSYHEVGHALVTALQKDSEPVQKITIVPRTMGALGYVMQVPEEEKYLNTKSELEAMIVECLGGRAAEEIVFGNVTTGASNDIEKATRLSAR